MAATIDQIMAGIKARLDTIASLRAYDYAPDNPVIPKGGAAAFPLVPAIPSYRETMRRGTYTIPFQVALLTGSQLDRVGQQRLAAYASPTGTDSVREAIEGDKTLGGLAHDTIVDSFDPNGLQEVGLVPYYGGTFAVRVIASGE
jgi:hypothetical protein